MELLSPDLSTSLFYNNIEVPCMLIVPAAFLLIVLYYTGYEKYITPNTLLLLSLATVIISFMEFTNPIHRLYYPSFSPINYDGTIVWMHGHGLLFWLAIAYIYFLTFLALILIISSLIGTGRHQRRPLFLLLVASCIPVLINILCTFNLIPPRGVDLTPIAFMFTGFILAFGLYRYLFFTMPVAYKRVITSMQDGVIITNGPVRIIDLNPAAEQIIGIRAHDALGRNIGEILPSLASCIAANDPENDTTRTECQIPHADGKIRHFDVVVMPLGSSGIGTSVGLYVLRDISHYKQAERALAEANRKISLLSSITRHDIRNQLMALNAYLLLSEDSMDDPVQSAEYLRMEQKITDTIAHQISFTKYYEDMGVNQPEWQDVASSIRQALDGLSIGTLHVEIGFDNLEMYADPLLEKVFYNLIDNTLRYGGPGVTTFRVTADTRDGSLELFFEDDGVGIAAGDKQVIFDKGFGKNTGLGLFLSREILSLTDAAIMENGEPGQGARFVIRVPAGAWRKTGPQ